LLTLMSFASRCFSFPPFHATSLRLFSLQRFNSRDIVRRSQCLKTLRVGSSRRWKDFARSISFISFSLPRLLPLLLILHSSASFLRLPVSTSIPPASTGIARRTLPAPPLTFLPLPESHAPSPTLTVYCLFPHLNPTCLTSPHPTPTAICFFRPFSSVQSLSFLLPFPPSMGFSSYLATIL